MEREAAFEWVAVGEEELGFTLTSGTRGRKRKRTYNRKQQKWRKKKKIELVGWGSGPLLQFLHSIGKDTSNPIPHHDVASIVNDYVIRNNLLHPSRKKRVLCDPSLFSLFGRKSIARVKIFDLLDPHLAENRLEDDDDDDDDDDDGYDYLEDEEEDEEEEERQLQHCKPPPPPPPPPPVSTPTGFAAIIPDNIRLVYLRRSLVEHLLLPQQQNQVDKILGSFVRAKKDPNDYLQKHPYVLLQLTGLNLNRASETDGSSSSEILLQVSGTPTHIHVSMLSDDNFTLEECEDLHQRTKAGLLKKPTVEELQQKAHILHEDITKHWLVRELALLQNLIDRANEKGWRKELFEYLERRKLLQTPDEQLRLLHELPKVTVEVLDIEAEPQLCADEIKQRQNNSTRSIPIEAPELPSSYAKIEECVSLWTPGAIDSTGSQHDVYVQEDWQKQSTEFIDKNDGEIQHLKVEAVGKITGSQVIDLSDDDDGDDENEKPSKIQVPEDRLGSLIWYYQDPLGNTQGPFAITSLKRWNDADYFPPDFKIWKTGQSSNEAVLLKDILNQA